MPHSVTDQSDKVVLGDLPPSGSVQIEPGVTTAYVLRATNQNGQQVTSLLRVDVFAPPAIEFFTATPLEVRPGSTEAKNIRLAWSIVGSVTDVQLLRTENLWLQNLSPQGTVTVGIDRTSIFVLKASNGPAVVEQSVQVTVVGTSADLLPPVVGSFAASSTVIQAGQPVTLTWQVDNVERVAIVPLPGDFPATGSTVVKPATTTTYTLVASNGQTVVTVSRQVTIR